MAVWNPWKGCHKKSEGCDNCYIHRANARKGIDTDLIYKTDEFYKPIERFLISAPTDIGEHFDHVTVCTTVENQLRSDERISFFKTLPIKHKMITVQPMLEQIDLSNYLDESIKYVIVGGESGKDLRPLNYDWVLDMRNQCIEKNVGFEFRQLGSTFIKEGKTYHIKRVDLCKQARKADIDYAPSEFIKKKNATVVFETKTIEALKESIKRLKKRGGIHA